MADLGMSEIQNPEPNDKMGDYVGNFIPHAKIQADYPCVASRQTGEVSLTWYLGFSIFVTSNLALVLRLNGRTNFFGFIHMMSDLG